MDWKTFALVFGTVFMAELGDKTQLATLLYAADANTGRTKVFLAAAAALVVSTALAVLAGAFVARYIPVKTLQIVAGVGFIAVGLWTLVSALRS